MSVGHGGLYHSQSPEGFFMGASGLKVSDSERWRAVDYLAFNVFTGCNTTLTYPSKGSPSWFYP